MGMGHPPTPAHPKNPHGVTGTPCRSCPQPGHVPEVQIQLLAAGMVPFPAGLVGRWGWIGASSLLSAGEELIILFSHYPGLKNPFLSSINLGA